MVQTVALLGKVGTVCSDVDRGADPWSRTVELLGASARGKAGKDPQEKHEPTIERVCFTNRENS